MRKYLVSMMFTFSALVVLNGCVVSEKKMDQGDRSLIFFSKKFVNSHNKLYLCSVIVAGTGTWV